MLWLSIDNIYILFYSVEHLLIQIYWLRSKLCISTLKVGWFNIGSNVFTYPLRRNVTVKLHPENAGRTTPKSPPIISARTLPLCILLCSCRSLLGVWTMDSRTCHKRCLHVVLLHRWCWGTFTLLFRFWNNFNQSLFIIVLSIWQKDICTGYYKTLKRV